MTTDLTLAKQTVLSLFDGKSCGQQALKMEGIPVETYYASEIDKYAIAVAKYNFPNTIHLGDVRHINGLELPKIDLLIGGSPCQSFSFAGKMKGMSTKDEIEIHTLDHYLELKEKNFQFEGQSYLFWEYMRLLNEVKPKYFFLENVIMTEKWERILSKAIGVNPIELNSSLVSAQNRRRLYWTNLGMKPAGLFGDMQSIITPPEEKGILLKDILQSNVDKKYYLSEKLIESFEAHAVRHNDKGTGFAWSPTEGDKKSACLRANAALAPTDNIVIQPQLTGNKRLNDTIAQSEITELPAMVDSYNKAIHYDKSITISTRVSASNLTHIIEKIVKVPEATRLGYAIAEEGDSINLTFPESKTRRGRVGKGVAQTLDTACNQETLINGKIRRLTPIECERLQTLPDDYTAFGTNEKGEKVNISDSQRYKMIGNGWTIDAVRHFFKYLKQ